jgi:hypothetical protein
VTIQAHLEQKLGNSSPLIKNVLKKTRDFGSFAEIEQMQQDEVTLVDMDVGSILNVSGF